MLVECTAGCAILSMDNYNDGSRVIDSNFDGALLLLFLCACTHDHLDCSSTNKHPEHVFAEGGADPYLPCD